MNMKLEHHIYLCDLSYRIKNNGTANRPIKIEVTRLKTVLIITSAIVVLIIQLAVEASQINIYQFPFKLLFLLSCILKLKSQR